MKIKTWQELLKQLKLQYIEKYHKDFFEMSGSYRMVIKPFSDKNTASLTTAIESFINYLPDGLGQATRVNSTGVPRKMNNGDIKWTCSNTRKGIADVIGSYLGRFLACEVKYGRDVQSPNQIKEMQRIRATGGVYIICKTFPQFLNEFLTYFPNVADQLQALGFDATTLQNQKTISK